MSRAIARASRGIERTGREGLICRDNIRADIRITFFVRVNKTTEDVIKVAQAIGTERASHEQTLQELFNAKFSEALKTVGKQLDFVDLYTRRNEGVSIWVVKAADITASSPDEKDPMFAPSGDKVYRHPTFYDIPDNVPHM